MLPAAFMGIRMLQRAVVVLLLRPMVCARYCPQGAALTEFFGVRLLGDTDAFDLDAYPTARLNVGFAF